MTQDTNVVYIARLKGSAYEMGYAYGQIYGEQIAKNFLNLQSYGRTKLESILGKLGVPSYIIDVIYGQIEPYIMYALDLNW